MMFRTDGSSDSAWRIAITRTLAICAVPIVLSACVAGQQQQTLGYATGGSPTVVPQAAPRGAGEAASSASAATALAPLQRENGTISGSAAIDRMIAQAADANNIPRDLAFGVVHVESTYNPRARGRGVYGLSQIMPSTARSLGFSGSSEDLLEPATNLRYGMRYLAGAWEKGGRDVCRASMKYKGGHRATTMTRSAASYCGRVRQHMARIAGNPILSDAPVAMAANAPATAAAVEVAAVTSPTPAARASAPASAEATAPVASAAALAPTPAPATSAVAAAMQAATHPTARPETAPAETASVETTAPAPAALEAEVAAVATVADAPAPQAADAVTGAPDPARFGG